MSWQKESMVCETKIMETRLYNGCTARILSKIGYQSGDIQYTISQINLYTGKSVYFRSFDNQLDAEMAF